MNHNASTVVLVVKCKENKHNNGWTVTTVVLCKVVNTLPSLATMEWYLSFLKLGVRCTCAGSVKPSECLRENFHGIDSNSISLIVNLAFFCCSVVSSQTFFQAWYDIHCEDTGFVANFWKACCASSCRSVAADGGSSATTLPGAPATLEKGAMTVSSPISVPGASQQLSLIKHRLPILHPSPIQTFEPIDAASMTQCLPIWTWPRTTRGTPKFWCIGDDRTVFSPI